MAVVTINFGPRNHLLFLLTEKATAFAPAAPSIVSLGWPKVFERKGTEAAHSVFPVNTNQFCLVKFHSTQERYAFMHPLAFLIRITFSVYFSPFLAFPI